MLDGMCVHVAGERENMSAVGPGHTVPPSHEDPAYAHTCTWPIKSFSNFRITLDLQESYRDNTVSSCLSFVPFLHPI